MNQCSTCTHWHRKLNIADMAAAPAGECRAQPPQLVLIPRDGGLVLTPFYPPLAGTFPACGLHTVRIELPSNGQLAPARG